MVTALDHGLLSGMGSAIQPTESRCLRRKGRAREAVEGFVFDSVFS